MDDKWHEYERLKRELPKDLTPEQYEAEIRKIVKRLKI